jgi:DNA repair exonuclease SbcCD ATPase subunit
LPEDKGADILIMAWERDLTRWEKKLKKVFAEEAPTEQAYNETSEDLEQLERTLSNAKTAIRDLEAGALPDIRQKIAQEETKEGFRKTLRAKLKRFRKEKAIHEAAFELGKAEMEFLRFCISVLNKDGLPVFLMGQILPRLSKLARYYSNLFSGGDISLQFGLVDEDVDVQIVNETGGEFIGDQSQGELRLASLICSFALRDLMSPCDVLIADEPGEGLDEPTARQFAKGLRNCSKRFPTILATTHNVHILSELSDQEQTIITKEGGVSSVG